LTRAVLAYLCDAYREVCDDITRSQYAAAGGGGHCLLALISEARRRTGPSIF
jgi:hypothetical protein